MRILLIGILAAGAACQAKKEDEGDSDPTTIEGIVAAAQNAHTVHTPYYTRFDLTTGLFEEMTPPNLERTLAYPMMAGDNLYLLGGFDNSAAPVAEVERYDAGRGSWSVVATRTTSGFSYDVQLGDMICGIGGVESWQKPVRREVDCLDTKTDTWSDRTPVPLENAFFSLVAYKGFAYVLGGVDIDARTPLDSAWRYDPATDQWRELARLPLGFFAGGTVTLDDKIYLVGGFKERVDDASASDVPKDTSMLIYDIPTDTWTTAPDMPTPRFLYGAGAIKGKVAVYFGVAKGAPEIEWYDPATGVWQAGAEPDEMPEGGSGLAVATAGGQVYFMVVGALDGDESKEHRGKLMEFDPDLNAWTVLGRRSTEHPYANFIGVGSGNYLHFVGAQSTIYY